MEAHTILSFTGFILSTVGKILRWPQILPTWAPLCVTPSSLLWLGPVYMINITPMIKL